MSTNFKFKPDKIKYLSNIDTLDSSHKRVISEINKKRIDKFHSNRILILS